MKYWIGFPVLCFFAPLFAGTLSCSVTTAAACTGGTNVVILRMSGSANAHAELANQSNSNYSSTVVCCSGVTGMTSTCSGTFATVAKLSGVTNAHVEQGTQTNYGNSACIQVPSGGSVSVGYGASCAGYDTTVASMATTPTNSHIGDGTAYANKICATAVGAGNLTIDIVDAGGVSVTSPSVTMNTTNLTLQYQTVTGTLGTSSQKIRVDNSTLNQKWTATLAASGGPTSLWSAGTPKYDFNDPTSGALDGADTDTYGGQMSVNPSVGTITPKSGCTNTGVSSGSSSAFSEGVTDSITLMTAGASSSTGCYWEMTGTSLSQTLPPQQALASYSLSMTLTIVAN